MLLQNINGAKEQNLKLISKEKKLRKEKPFLSFISTICFMSLSVAGFYNKNQKNKQLINLTKNHAA